MKTPTLLIRLIGLYLLLQNTAALIQAQKLNTITRNAGLPLQVAGNVQLYAIVGLLVGLGATLFAGAIARILTFDAGRE